MIKAETITLNGREFKRTYSDSDKYIRKIGTDEIYTEAVDVPESTYMYEETDIMIEMIESGAFDSPDNWTEIYEIPQPHETEVTI